MTFIDILVDVYSVERSYRISAGNAMPANFQYEVASKIVENLDDKIIDKVDLLYGHMPIQSDQRLRDYKYITMLRNPIARVISDYNYVRSKPANPLYLLAKDLSLQEYVSRNLDLHLDNLQTRILCGKITGQLSNVDLELATNNLNTRFVGFGLTEQFELSLANFHNILGWNKVPEYRSKNVNNKKHTRVDESVISAIKNFNSFDLRLYSYCEKRLSQLNGNVKIPKQEVGTDPKLRIAKFLRKVIRIKT